MAGAGARGALVSAPDWREQSPGVWWLWVRGARVARAHLTALRAWAWAVYGGDPLARGAVQGECATADAARAAAEHAARERGLL